MKRMSTVLVAVAMMVGSLATGCRKPADQAVAPETAPAAAQPAQDSAKPASEERTTVEASVAVRAPAPPALRVESPGRAPSPRHVWQRGYWRYEAPRTEYVWVPGYWEDTAVVAPYAPPAVRYEDPGYAPSVEFAYVPGYWRWSGAEYVWIYGHWSRRADCGYYYRPSWVNEHGRWSPRVDRWSYERADVWYREHRAARQAADPRPAYRGEGHTAARPGAYEPGRQAAAPTTGGHQAAAPSTGGHHQAAAPGTSTHTPPVAPHVQQPAHRSEPAVTRVPVVVNHPSPAHVTPVRAAAAPVHTAPIRLPATPVRRRG